MRKIRLKSVLSMLLAVTVIFTFMTGCGNGSSDEKGEGEEIILNMVDPGNTGYYGLDPANENSGRTATLGITETLLKLDNETNEVLPHLAESYEQKDDTTWVLKIRDGVKFSNGEPLTGEAVKLAMDYIVENNTRQGTQLNIASIEADGQTVTLRTNTLVATMPNILTAVEIFYYDENALDFDNDGIIGTGPFALKEWDLEGNKELVRNDDYWQGKPAAAGAHVIPIMDKSALTLALQAKEVDWGTDVTAADIVLFENNSEYNVVEYDKGRLYFNYLNPNYTFTQDPAMREALQYAFDRQSYIDGIYDGRGRAVTAIFPDWSGYNDTSVQQEAYNPEKAKEILAEAGYTDTDGDGFLEKDGQKVVLNITTYDSNGFSTLSQAIQGSLREIGLDSEIYIAEQIDVTLGEGQFNIAIFGHSTLTNGDCYNILSSIFTTEGYENYINYSNESIDNLVQEMASTSDASERERIAVEIQKEIYDSNNYVFMLHVKTYNVALNEVENIGTFRNNTFDLWKVTK